MQSTRPLLVRLTGLALALFACLAAHSQSPPWSTFASLDDRPRSQASQDLSRLVLLRPRAMQDSGAPVDIWLDGRFHTTVLPGAFTETEFCPGNRRLELAAQANGGPSQRSSHALSTLARQTQYVMVQTQAGKASHSQLSAQQAQALLPSLRRQAHTVSRLLPAQDCPALTPSAPMPVPQRMAVAPLPLPLPAPTAAPMPAVAPAATAPARYTLAAEMLFNFAGSRPQHLSEQGQTQIVRLGKRIKDQLRPGQVIVVQGHTDPMGSAALNQRLSLERAQTVSRILVNSGLPARQVRAEGLGSSQLLVKDCQQMAKTRDARLNCNRPNRRVEITVTPAKN